MNWLLLCSNDTIMWPLLNQSHAVDRTITMWHFSDTIGCNVTAGNVPSLICTLAPNCATDCKIFHADNELRAHYRLYDKARATWYLVADWRSCQTSIRQSSLGICAWHYVHWTTVNNTRASFTRLYFNKICSTYQNTREKNRKKTTQLQIKVM